MKSRSVEENPYALIEWNNSVQKFIVTGQRQLGVFDTIHEAIQARNEWLTSKRNLKYETATR